MTELFRHKTLWTGFAGGPAVTTLYSTAIPVPSSIKTFYTAIKTQMPIAVTWTIQGAGDKIEDSTGALTGAWSSGPDTTENGSATTSNYAAPAGVLVRLTTSTIVNRRRLKGRIFLVPCVNGVFDTNGTLVTGNLNTFQAAATALVSSFAGSLVIWSRPFKGRPAVGTKPALPARAGSNGIVTGAVIPDYVTVLRSRRD